MPQFTRRLFITSTAAAAAVPSVSTAAAASGSASMRIDCQSHLFVPELLAHMKKRTTDPRNGTRYVWMGGWLRKVPPL